jgi:hypothetical protein
MRAIYCKHVNAATVARVAAMDTAFEGLHPGEVVLVRSDGDGNEARRRIAAVMTRIIGDFEILPDGRKVPTPEPGRGRKHVTITFEPLGAEPPPSASSSA